MAADEIRTTPTPEQDKLLARFTETVMPDGTKQRIVDAHVSWGPEAASLTDEERAGIINNVLDQAEAQDKELVSVRLADLRIVYAAMERAVRLGQSTHEEYLAASPEVRELRSRIFSALDIPLLHASQMLPRALRQDMDQRAGDQNVG